MRGATPTVSILVFAAFSIASASGGTRASHYVVADPDTGRDLAEFTEISSSGGGLASASRVLYEDDRGRRVVIRTRIPYDRTDSRTYRCVRSGETLTVERVFGTSLTIGFAGRRLRIDASTVDKKATRLPPAIAARVEELLRGLSPDCRAALHRLTEIGTSYAIELYGAAAGLRDLVASDAPMGPTTTCGPSRLEYVIEPFDPASDRPDAFETRFGDSYYR